MPTTFNHAHCQVALADCKTHQRYVERNDSRIYLVFGLTADCLLVCECYFRGDTLYYRPMQQLLYGEISALISRADIVRADDGSAIRAPFNDVLDDADCSYDQRQFIAYAKRHGHHCVALSTGYVELWLALGADDSHGHNGEHSRKLVLWPTRTAQLAFIASDATNCLLSH